ncbi:MAG TPA: NADPH-dependent FMN reductase [Cytophagales bacterium]|nr:NADPH-dependent FMN reductase [Cytophagales bacterium]
MANRKKKIFAISGSTRTNSSNEAILKLIATLYSEAMEVCIFNEIDGLPHYNPDLDTEEVPTNVKNFRKQIEAAEGVIICTPEYVFSLPGSLKNAIEWTVSTTIFLDKPTALIVASSMGEKAFESLTLIMKTVGAKMTESTRLLIKGARSKLNEKGGFSDEQTAKEIERLVISLTEVIDNR